MVHKHVIGIGLNISDARAILLRDDGKIVAKIEKDRGDISANETIGDTTEVFGVTRGAGTQTYMDCAFVNGGDDALDLTELDAIMTAVEKNAGIPAAIVCSHDKADEISQ